MTLTSGRRYRPPGEACRVRAGCGGARRVHRPVALPWRRARREQVDGRTSQVYEDQPPRRPEQRSTDVATEHVETLLAAAQELTEACVMIAKQLRPRPSDGPPEPDEPGLPALLAAADLLERAADSTGGTRRLLRST